MATAPPPLVLVYDRRATKHHAPLGLRLDGCRNRAALHGWEIAGIRLDLGDTALTDGHRPQFHGLCGAMAAYADRREVLCLVHTWQRLTRTDARPEYQRKVATARGYTATCLGEDDRRVVATERSSAHAGSRGRVS
ncbi:hypothetical protein ACFV94_15065 [Streptomyces sp. NPDC059896]|uniref:hypothetical protein n=1 Tax=unclassified Streptomyces TaxID=2593676 RepID=UPI00364CE57F